MKKQYIIIALVGVIILLLTFICWRFYGTSLSGPVATMPSGMSSMMGTSGTNTDPKHYHASNSSALETRAAAKTNPLVKLNNGDIYAMNISEVKKEINGKLVPEGAVNR